MSNLYRNKHYNLFYCILANELNPRLPMKRDAHSSYEEERPQSKNDKYAYLNEIHSNHRIKKQKMDDKPILSGKQKNFTFDAFYLNLIQNSILLLENVKIHKDGSINVVKSDSNYSLELAEIDERKCYQSNQRATTRSGAIQRKSSGKLSFHILRLD